MADLGGTFDPNTVEPQKPFEALRDGWYVMKVVESKINPSKKNPEHRHLDLTWEIDESYHPEHKGRKAWTILNLWNSETASRIAQQELSAICLAVASPPITDSEQLHHIPAALKLVFVPAGVDDRGQPTSERNKIAGYDTVANRFAVGTSPVARAPVAQPAPAAGQVTAQAAVPTNAPAWARRSS